MQFTPFVILSALCAVASAHFRLQFPTPRGPFVEDDEPTYCDGYAHSVSNRTQFPLSGGFISLTSEHPVWTFGVILSTAQDPQNFNNFTQAVPFFQVSGEGAFCFPVDFAAAGITGVTDGANVTIQLEFDGGDGELFQCADLTLSSNATVPSGTGCTNASVTSVQTLPSSAIPTILDSSSGAPSSTSPASSTTPGSSSSTSTSPSGTGSPNAALTQSAAGFSGLLGLAGVVLALF